MSRAELQRHAIAKRYTNDHEWVEFDTTTGQGTVSITDYAQKSLGDVVFVELPTVGAEFAKGGPPIPSSHQTRELLLFLTRARTDLIGAVESVKAASDIVSKPAKRARRVRPHSRPLPSTRLYLARCSRSTRGSTTNLASSTRAPRAKVCTHFIAL